MTPLIEAFELVRDFMERGGPILTWIFLVILLIWGLVFERLVYFKTGHRKQVNEVMGTWEARSERTSWFAHKIREAMISQVTMDLRGTIPLIKTLVAVCPLLGLLGTVTGMIEVFDVMAILGSGNVRAMAAGVSKATIPTMAGMVGALSGVFASSYLENRANKEAEMLEDHLTMDH
ncbi:MotA/TolQ/ExbB proton channel family protein [Emcibacter sp.]|uniref:MotA/TolQ/ExbB proton channel family protein n=1 Tax=Emcibacter sp. TaxID=1979954 RepID=UPI003A932625